MAQSFTGRLDVKIAGTYGVDIDIGNRSYTLSKTYTNSFANGTAAEQANSIFTDTRTVAASSNDDLDVAGGITDAFGNTITFTNIKMIIVNAAAANTNDVLIGAEGTNPFSTFFGDATDKLILKPGGTFCLSNPGADGYGVTASTGDILRLANSSSGTSVTYDIVIIGEVAV